MNIIKRIININWNGVIPLIKQAHQQSKRSYLSLILDLYKCGKEGYTCAEYVMYDFHRNKDQSYRDTFISVRKHYPIITKELGQNVEDTEFFDDKGLFNRNFKDIKGIDTLDLRVDELESFKKFISENPEFFIKTVDGYGGHEVKRVLRNEYPNMNDEELYRHFKNNKYYVIEQKIIQHSEMCKLSVNSVNTLRVVTMKDKDNNITAPFVISRISLTESFLDNATLGGGYCIVGKDGIIHHDYEAVNPIIRTYDKNPINGFKFKGFKFPYFQESINLCIEASKRCKGHLIGWDIAISENGPVLIEANIGPGCDFLQTYNQLDEKHGRIKEFEEGLKIKLH